MVEGGDEGPWSVERRFRVTEVFLALLWVSFPDPTPICGAMMWDGKRWRY